MSNTIDDKATELANVLAAKWNRNQVLGTATLDSWAQDATGLRVGQDTSRGVLLRLALKQMMAEGLIVEQGQGYKRV